jgi:excisionase family DNA binding protein
MSVVSNPDTDTFLRMLVREIQSSEESATSAESAPMRDDRSLERLVRLIVRDELRHYADSFSSSASDADNDEAKDPRPSEQIVKDTEKASDGDSDAEVMCAEDVAAFLGVDRNTVYDYAGRGAIPCRRLGKRLLFHRPALVAWLDPCKAASTRKG